MTAEVITTMEISHQKCESVIYNLKFQQRKSRSFNRENHSEKVYTRFYYIQSFVREKITTSHLRRELVQFEISAKWEI